MESKQPVIIRSLFQVVHEGVTIRYGPPDVSINLANSVRRLDLNDRILIGSRHRVAGLYTTSRYRSGTWKEDLDLGCELFNLTKELAFHRDLPIQDRLSIEV